MQWAGSELERRLPDGWRFVEFRRQPFCRRPVKLSACGATVEGPDGRRLLAVSTDEHLGVPAVRGLADAVEGRVTPARDGRRRGSGPREKVSPRGRTLDEPETPDEAAVRDEALELLPEGAVPMNVDSETFGNVRVYAVVVQMPDGLGTAGVGLTAADAWRALSERQRGELAEATVWFPRR